MWCNAASLMAGGGAVLFEFWHQVNAKYHPIPYKQWGGLEELQMHYSPYARWVNLQMSNCTQRLQWGGSWVIVVTLVSTI